MLQDGSDLRSLKIGKNWNSDCSTSKDAEVGHYPLWTVLTDYGHLVARFNACTLEHYSNMPGGILKLLVIIIGSIHTGEGEVGRIKLSTVLKQEGKVCNIFPFA